MGDLRQPKWIDCNKCGAQNKAFLMVKCPKCKKYYVPELHRDPLTTEASICPHCDTNLVEAMKEARRKGR
jgi:phage FluMu protein Com